MGLFEGKKGLILGVFNEHSLGWAIADKIMGEGGVCGFNHMPDKPDDDKKRNHRRVSMLLDALPHKDRAKFLVPMNVQNDADVAAIMDKTKQEFGKIDFLLHSIAFAPPEDLAKSTVDTSRNGFLTGMDISAYSLIAVSRAARPIMSDNSSILTLTYFGGEKCVPGYNVMGICKAALDSIVKYLAFDLGPNGIRVNALSAGPMKTVSGKGAGVDAMLRMYEYMAPIGRNMTHDEIGNTGAFLLSDMSSGMTAEIMHVDGGYNAMGTPGRLLDKLKEAEAALKAQG